MLAWEYRRMLLTTVCQPALKLDYFSLVDQVILLLFPTCLFLMQLKGNGVSRISRPA